MIVLPAELCLDLQQAHFVQPPPLRAGQEDTLRKKNALSG